MAARKQQIASNGSADQAEAFKRLAGKRVPKAIQALRSVGKLAHKGSYSYTPAQAAKVIETLEAELATIRSQFESGEVNREGITFEV